ncbi:MAG: hypothetical protein EGS39_01275 [Bifidobacterium bifidum]|nr:hypothetical protein [Bifidobacterium bifidum]
MHPTSEDGRKWDASVAAKVESGLRAAYENGIRCDSRHQSVTLCGYRHRARPHSVTHSSRTQ